jgi:hypothetical protein
VDNQAAVLTRVGEIALEQVPVPEPGPREVLIEVAAVGISGRVGVMNRSMRGRGYARPARRATVDGSAKPRLLPSSSTSQLYLDRTAPDAFNFIKLI